MNSEETTEIGAYIKKIRESKNLGVNQLAQYAGVSAAQISRIENGKRENPKPETLAKLAKALKVDYDELMSKAGYIDTDEKKKNEEINTAFHDFDNLTDEEKEHLEIQLEIFRELKKRKMTKERNEDK
ncbi:Transcriptional regulator, contains XRE-family HTH domain [Bacillus sp. OV166]|uniref:helix-turn-helix domain-containing protein n=1 Tax=unclassified Bacillus (in: firmicutes) TaxID=185979 RepID=UPI000A2AADA9|nr:MULTISPECIES: helix-turn-helix domain-containing protein [unclassified Bacillus (in: firmicutes)]SMQ75782.1 Transcriptional regulator, contains XRE-family HTH domain [Bacillus sp. OV166]